MVDFNTDPLDPWDWYRKTRTKGTRKHGTHRKGRKGKILVLKYVPFTTVGDVWSFLSEGTYIWLIFVGLFLMYHTWMLWDKIFPFFHSVRVDFLGRCPYPSLFFYHSFLSPKIWQMMAIENDVPDSSFFFCSKGWWLLTLMDLDPWFGLWCRVESSNQSRGSII